MPNIVFDLLVDRVDFVDEGADSAAFIELFKRKEKEAMDVSEILSKLKPEHAEVINAEIEAVKEDLAKARNELADTQEQLNEANEALAKSNAELEVTKAAKTDDADDDKDCQDDGDCGETDTDKNMAFDEQEVLKAMPEAARELFNTMRMQKEAAEELVRKSAEEKKEAEAIAKAASLKALPVEQSKLVDIIKSTDENVHDLLSTINAAIETTVLGEVGKSNKTADNTGDAWERIEAKAVEVAKSKGITKEKAVGIVIRENPELYKEYLDGGK